MIAYVIRRLIIAVVLIVLVSLVVFLCMRFLPGDPLMVYMPAAQLQNLTPEDLEELRGELGLDRPLMVQYFDWMNRALHGDLGDSILLREPVTSLIFKRLPITAHLGILALAISAIFGIGFGVICALRRGTWIDSLFTVMANIGITVPVFWLGILLIYFISLKLGWLPPYGYTSPFEDFWLSTRQVIMPVICLAVGPLAGLTRQSRSAMLEVIEQDYIRTAWAKGLKERVIVMRHALKNSMIPVVTFLGLFVAMVFGGSVIVETIFNIPGMGRLIVNAIFQQDYQIVQGGVLVVSSIVILANLIVDISYAWLDPRIRYR